MVSAVILNHKLSYSLVQFQTIFSWVQVDVLTLECAEEAFDESIIGCSCFAIRRDFCSKFFESTNPVLTGMLRPLVRIDDFRLTIARYNRVKHSCLIFLVETVCNLPAHNKAAVNVYIRVQLKSCG